MDYNKPEISVATEFVDVMQNDYRELNDVELALIGGGIGDVIVG